MELDSTDSQAPALQRGLAVLEFLSGRNEAATLSEISAALKLSPASIFRLTGVLESAGYLHREETSRRFSLTRKLFLQAQPKHEGRSLVECCLPSMREILQLTGETVQLCCLADNQCVMLEQLPSTYPFKYIVDLGSRISVHCCAPGKAIAAYLTEEGRSALIHSLILERYTDQTIVSKRDLLEELEKIKNRGYAADQGEHFDGIHCIAAPLLDRHGNAVAAITIAGPSSRIQVRRFAEFGAIIKQATTVAAQRYLG
ncbi:HTH-type transcriptional repressor AllR [soil metagenome]